MLVFRKMLRTYFMDNPLLISFSLEKDVKKAGDSHRRSRRTTVLMDMVKAARKTGNREGIFFNFFPTLLQLEFAKSGNLRALRALTLYLTSMPHVPSYVKYFRDLCVKTGLICNLFQNKCLKFSSVIRTKRMNMGGIC